MTSYATGALRDKLMHYGAPPAHGDDSHGVQTMTAEEEQEFRYCHPDSRVLFNVCPWIRRVPIFGKACEAYGPKCTLSLGLCYFLCKGIADQTISYARYPMFVERFGISAERYQRLANISTMGWSIKAFTAALCDTFAFLGYTKRWYMFISCVAGAVFALIYGLLPAKPSSADTAAAFVFLTSYGKANVDILSEGHYSRLLKKLPKAGPALVSWIWFFIMIGAIIAAGMQGPLSDKHKMQVGVFISAGLQFVTCFIFLFNLYGERKNRVERLEDARILYKELTEERAKLGLPGENVEGDVAPRKDMHPENFHWEGDAVAPAEVLDDELVMAADDNTQQTHDEGLAAAELAAVPIPGCCGLFEMNKEVAMRNWRVYVYSGVMTCAVITMTCGNILANKLGLLIICVIVSCVCCATSFWALPLVIAKANVFGYLQMVVYLQLPGAVDSFYLAKSDCIADGPHFSYTFYNTIGAVIGNVAGLAGVTAFNYLFSKHSYRLTFIITTLVQIIASIFDIIMVKRWNIYIGIPDHAMYICGDAVVYQACYMLAWMPMIVLLSRLCPRGSESVVYALMAGFSNLGQSTSSAIGAILMEYAWPVQAKASVGPCDFSNVPWLLFVGHLLLPLLVIPLTLLLPSARICDDLDVDGKAIKQELKREPHRDEEDVAHAIPETPIVAHALSEDGHSTASDGRE